MHDNILLENNIKVFKTESQKENAMDLQIYFREREMDQELVCYQSSSNTYQFPSSLSLELVRNLIQNKYKG